MFIMQSILYPCDQTYWYLKRNPAIPLKQSHKTQVLVIGGGMAGLTAAQSFLQKGHQVTLIEKYFCGSGASGKSSGFITPYSELGVDQLATMYGLAAAKNLWDFVSSGVELIRSNIEQYGISCDYRVQDTLVVANSKKSFATIEAEHHFRRKLSYDSILYSAQELQAVLGSQRYFGGVSFSKTFSINAYDYCQAMKEILQKQGVQIFEETPALAINDHEVTTPHGMVKADYIIVCIDRSLPDLKKLTADVYQVQTFLLISQPLSAEQMRSLFPEKQLQVWDTDLIYQYFRPAQDNRLLVGGCDLIASYWGREQHHAYRIYKKLSNYMNSKFPQMKLNLTFMWPGLIGIAKDIMPIASRDKKFSHIYYVSAATGLPWAAALGNYSLQHMLEKRNDLDEFFDPDRKYPISNTLQRFLGKRISFGLSNIMRIYDKA